MAVTRGTPGTDRLTGTPGDNPLFGLGGDDTLIGLEGDDRLDGGTGRDEPCDEEGGVGVVIDPSGDTTAAPCGAEPGSSVTTGRATSRRS